MDGGMDSIFDEDMVQKLKRSGLCTVERTGKVFTVKTSMLPKSCHATLMRFNGALVKKIEAFSRTRLNFPSLRLKSNMIEIIGRWNDVNSVLELFFDIFSGSVSYVSKGMRFGITETEIETLVEQFCSTISMVGRCTCKHHSSSKLKHKHQHDDDDDYDDDDDDNFDDSDDDDYELSSDHSCSTDDEEDVKKDINDFYLRVQKLLNTNRCASSKAEPEGVHEDGTGKATVEKGLKEKSGKSESSKTSKIVSGTTAKETGKKEPGKSLKEESKNDLRTTLRQELKTAIGDKNTNVIVVEDSERKKKKRRRRTETVSSCNSDPLSDVSHIKNTKITNLKERNRTSSDSSSNNQKNDSNKTSKRKDSNISSSDPNLKNSCTELSDVASKTSSKKKNRTASSSSSKSNCRPEPTTDSNKAITTTATGSGDNLKNNTLMEFLSEGGKPEVSKLNTYQNYLKMGSEALIANNFSKAITNLKLAKDVSKNFPEASCASAIVSAVFTYTLCFAYIKSGSYENIILAINELNSIPSNMLSRLPAIKFLLACACHKLNRFKIAEETLEELFSILEKEVVILESFFYPGTKIFIPETGIEYLRSETKKLESDCRLTQHNAVAVCRFEKCSELSSHIYPSKYIYTSDPDFNGYIVVICQEKCDVEYHLNCWKAYKESKVALPGKVTDKDFLGQPCPTMDCVLVDGSFSPIIKIDIYDCQGSLKHSTALDVSKLKADASKKKEKEKQEKAEKIEKSKVIERASSQKKIIPEEANKAKAKLTPVKKPPPVEKKPSSVDKIKTPQKLEFSLSSSDKLEKKKMDYEEELVACFDRMEALRVMWPSQRYIDPSIAQVNYEEDFPADHYNDGDGIKTFIWSMFKEMLLAEGSQNVSDIKSKWACSEEFRDVRMMLKDSDDICAILLESNDFYILEDRLALQTQLPEVYSELKCATLETLTFVNKDLFKPLAEPAKKVDTNLDPFRFLPPLNDSSVTNIKSSVDDPFRFLPPLDQPHSNCKQFSLNQNEKPIAPRFAKGQKNTSHSEENMADLSEFRHTKIKSKIGNEDLVYVTNSLSGVDKVHPSQVDPYQSATKDVFTDPDNPGNLTLEETSSVSFETKLADSDSFKEPLLVKNSSSLESNDKLKDLENFEEPPPPETNLVSSKPQSQITDANNLKEPLPERTNLKTETLNQLTSNLIQSVSQIYLQVKSNQDDSTNPPFDVESNVTQESNQTISQSSAVPKVDSVPSEDTPTLLSDSELCTDITEGEVSSNIKKADKEESSQLEKNLAEGTESSKDDHTNITVNNLVTTVNTLIENRSRSSPELTANNLVTKINTLIENTSRSSPELASVEKVSINSGWMQNEAHISGEDEVISAAAQREVKLSRENSVESRNRISNDGKSDLNKAGSEELYDSELSEECSEQSESVSEQDLLDDDDHISAAVCSEPSNLANGLGLNKNLTDNSSYSINLPNNEILHLSKGISVTAILKEIEQVLSFIHEFDETNEINFKILNSLVNNFLSKFDDTELKKINMECDNKIIFKKKVKMCLYLCKKISQYFMNKCMDTLETIQSFGSSFIERYNHLVENSDLDIFNCDNFNVLSQTPCYSTMSVNGEPSASVRETDSDQEEKVEKLEACCQTNISSCVDAEMQTDCSPPPVDKERNRLFDHVKSQNSAILEFCNQLYPLMPPMISENYEDMKSGNESFENTPDDLVNLLSLNTILTKSLAVALDSNCKKFKLMMESALSDLKTRQIDFVFKLLRSRYSEKIVDYEGFLKKFCTNSTRNLKCWTEIQSNIEHFRKMLHQLNYKENVFKLKHRKLVSKLAEAGAIDIDDVKELFDLGFDQDPELILTVSTIEEVFVSLLKAAANEFQKQNQQVLMKVLLQAKEANMITPDLTAQILMQQHSTNQKPVASTPPNVTEYKDSFENNFPAENTESSSITNSNSPDSLPQAAKDTNIPIQSIVEVQNTYSLNEAPPIEDYYVDRDQASPANDYFDERDQAPPAKDYIDDSYSLDPVPPMKNYFDDSFVNFGTHCDDKSEYNQNSHVSEINICDDRLKNNKLQSTIDAAGSNAKNHSIVSDSTNTPLAEEIQFSKSPLGSHVSANAPSGTIGTVPNEFNEGVSVSGREPNYENLTIESKFSDVPSKVEIVQPVTQYVEFCTNAKKKPIESPFETSILRCSLQNLDHLVGNTSDGKSKSGSPSKPKVPPSVPKIVPTEANKNQMRPSGKFNHNENMPLNVIPSTPLFIPPPCKSNPPKKIDAHKSVAVEQHKNVSNPPPLMGNIVRAQHYQDLTKQQESIKKTAFVEQYNDVSKPSTSTHKVVSTDKEVGVVKPPAKLKPVQPKKVEEVKASQKKTEVMKTPQLVTSKTESKFLSMLKDSCFKKLMVKLKEKYPKKSDTELILYLRSVRQRNRDSLTGMSFNEILALVDSMVETPNFSFPKFSGGASSARPNASAMGLEKFGQSAWVKNEVRDNSNYSNEDLKECCICFTRMERNTMTTLSCKHIFHTKCIRGWLNIKCVCPLCQAFCRMPDEFPSLC